MNASYRMSEMPERQNPHLAEIFYFTAAPFYFVAALIKAICSKQTAFFYYRTRQGFFGSNFQPGIRYCIPTESSLPPRQ